MDNWEENLENIKFGFVAIIGKPNSGKSTLINSILEQKIAITTHRKNTTRNKIRGIYNDDDSQIIFIDTPGFLEAKTKLDEKMKSTITNSVKDVDVILFLSPFWKSLDFEYFEKLKTLNNKTKKIFLLTQIDKTTNKAEIFEKGQEVMETNLFDQVIPISSIKGYNVEELITVIKKYLKDDHPYFDRKKSYEFEDEFYVAEIIREKILVFLNYEIPHHTFVKTVALERKRDVIRIRVEIFVDKDSQKIIVIGKGGEKLKLISSTARKELEVFFGKKVHIEVFVKVRKNWQNKQSIIEGI